MQIDVAAPAVVRRQAKNHAHAMHGALRHSRAPQIRFSELHAAALDVSPNVLELPAAQIINHSNSRAPFEQRFHQVGTDKRRSACNQNATSCPIHMLLQFHAASRHLAYPQAVRTASNLYTRASSGTAGAVSRSSMICW